MKDYQATYELLVSYDGWIDFEKKAYRFLANNDAEAVELARKHLSSLNKERKDRKYTLEELLEVREVELK